MLVRYQLCGARMPQSRYFPNGDQRDQKKTKITAPAQRNEQSEIPMKHVVIDLPFKNFVVSIMSNEC